MQTFSDGKIYSIEYAKRGPCNCGKGYITKYDYTWFLYTAKILRAHLHKKTGANLIKYETFFFTQTFGLDTLKS